MSKDKVALTFGSDPEFMLQRNGRFYSAVPLVPGTKYKRHKLGHHYYYYDNVMAECAVRPADNPQQFVNNLRECLQQFAKLVRPYTLTTQASQDYPVAELQSEEAQAIGCDPEYCAYQLSVAPAPEEEFRSGTLRTAGGHIHLGTHLGKETFGCLAIIRMLDLFLGSASIFLDKDPTTKKRKNLYGKAGRFRQPEWGVEYRSLGNFWLASPDLVVLVLDVCSFVVDFVAQKQHERFWTIDLKRLNDDNAWNEEGFHPSQCHHCVGYDIAALRRDIDSMDKRQGAKWLEFTSKFMPAELHSRILDMAGKGPFDLYKEWQL